MANEIDVELTEKSRINLPFKILGGGIIILVPFCFWLGGIWANAKGIPARVEILETKVSALIFNENKRLLREEAMCKAQKQMQKQIVPAKYQVELECKIGNIYETRN